MGDHNKFCTEFQNFNTVHDYLTTAHAKVMGYDSTGLQGKIPP